MAADEDHVPDLHHALLFLHHDRVQKRRAGEPGKEGGVLHRIPHPVAAPAENVISPGGTQHDAGALEKPGDDGPAARGVNPAVAGRFRNQRRHGEGEGNREPHVAEIKHRRMNHHRPILQQRIQAHAVRNGGDHLIDAPAPGTG